jgi:crotonobetainyl-CoA:carnitine CoA-transferase CaiB-like acyl-CoA transferase
MINAPTFFSSEHVVELAGVLAGPLVGRFFSEHGARVVKIENPFTGGDVTRTWRTEAEDESGLSAYYISVNQGKESILLNLKSALGMEQLNDLLDKATILLTNFRPIDQERFGISFDAIRKRFPRLIIGQVDGFSAGDNRPAYDIVLQAESGFLAMSGTVEGELVKMPVALIDVLAAQHLKAGILMAMLNRQQTGEGSLVRVSLRDAALASLVNQSAAYLKTNVVSEPLGLLHPFIAPYGECFEAKDGKRFVLAVGSDAQFQKLLEICRIDTADNASKFSSNKLRVEFRDELFKELAPIFRTDERAIWMEKMLQSGIPCGAIFTLSEVFEQPYAKSMLVHGMIDNLEVVSVKTSPIFFA